MDETFTKHLPFSLLAKNFKKQSFEAWSLKHSGKDQFDPVLAKLRFFDPLLRPPAWQAQDQIDPSQNDLRIVL